ncbi:MAG: TonB-dependent receptor [Microscillaceae bacterium]|nr:TonB-dependent receptor [Microscillaceae bacterium]MDW8460920.1 TonB-dependent receptor [Cytophagales bacterium]
MISLRSSVDLQPNRTEEITHKALSPLEKARQINLDPNTYGSFAEIGAGQEVAAFFFKAGGASNTVAKTMSAYDMTFSNAIYGAEESGRYVVESRLLKMLNKEYALLEQRLGIKMGFERCFFAFADTVTTINYAKTSQGHGWLGVRFQLKPQTAPNELIAHVRMYDNDTISQQQAIGIIGVNMIYACYHYYNDIDMLVKSLMDHLSPERIEIDMVRVSGPDFEHVDNRLLSLKLVQYGLTNAAIFNPDGKVMNPADVFYKKNVLVLRGRFRPMTNVNLDMLKRGYEQFSKEKDVKKENIEVIAELTIKDLSAAHGGQINYQDFLDRVDILCSVGCTVMISNYYEYYRLVSYLSQHTRSKIGIVLGVYNLLSVFDEKYYENLKGGILESFSTLFSRNVKMYLYPALKSDGKTLCTCENFELPSKSQEYLFKYLLANDKIEDIKEFDRSILGIFSDNVLQMIKEGRSGWEEMVPDNVARVIKEKCLFGYVPNEKETPTPKNTLSGLRINEITQELMGEAKPLNA